jgi:hypothetical protein
MLSTLKIYAVVRIKAPDRKKAESALASAMDCADLRISITETDGMVTLTEASLDVDDVEFPFLFEVDGIPIEDYDDLVE